MRPSTQQKLTEAQFFLELMGKNEGREHYAFYLSAFLNAASGLFDVMHNEYHDVVGFQAWYESNVEPRISQRGDLRWFIDRRIQAQHRRALVLRTELEEVGFIPTQHPNPRRPQFRLERPTTSRIMPIPGTAPVRHLKARWYFASVNQPDAWTHCDGFLERVNAIAQECSNRFG